MTIGLTECYSQHAQPELRLVQQHPPNKAVTPQRPFFSTHKRQKTATIRLAKPSSGEKDNIKTRLENTSRLYTTLKKYRW